jgi:hypothetical protein
MSDSTRIRVCLNQVWIDSLQQKSQEVWHDDHDQNWLEHNSIEKNIRVLNVQIDTRLKWDLHVQKIQKKMTKQIMILTKLSTFTWRVIFCKTRILHIFVVLLTLIYKISSDTCSRTRNQRRFTDLSSYKIDVYSAYLKSFEFSRLRFLRLKLMLFSSTFIWISYRRRRDIACELQTCRSSFARNVDS